MAVDRMEYLLLISNNFEKNVEEKIVWNTRKNRLRNFNTLSDITQKHSITNAKGVFELPK